MSNQHLGTNNFGNCKWIVNSNKALGTHTTISSAISSASSGDDIFIMPGTYTENPTISKNVNLVAFDCDSQNQTVEINGQITISSGVTTCISNIYLYGPASPMITDSSGSGITAYFINCNIYYGGAALATVMSFSTATSSSYYFKNCF